MKIAIINGPNLNLLGKREPEIYGTETFESFLEKLKPQFPAIQFTYFQSNIEGELIDAIQQLGFSHQALIINAAAYTHTSIGIADAVKAVPATSVEVHLSNIWQREPFRHQSYLSGVVKGVIAGFGLQSYILAVEYLIKSN